MEIQRLTDERIPSEVSRMSQQELIFIAEFLKGFDKIESSTGSRKGVNLEKLGQYLRHEPLQTCLKPEGSEWATMLNENHCLRDHSLIMKQDLNFSLLQSHEKLVNAVRDVFSVAYEDLVDHFAVLKLPLMTSASVLSSQIVTNDGNFLIASTDVERKFLRLFQVEPLLTNTSSVSLYLKSIIIDVDNKQGWSMSIIISNIKLYISFDVKLYSLMFTSFSFFFSLLFFSLSFFLPPLFFFFLLFTILFRRILHEKFDSGQCYRRFAILLARLSQFAFIEQTKLRFEPVAIANESCEIVRPSKSFVLVSGRCYGCHMAETLSRYIR